MPQNIPANTNDVTRITNELNPSSPVTPEIECTCVSCGNVFTLSAEEQDWYLSLGYSIPKRCFTCRKIRRAEKTAFDRGRKHMLNTISAIGETLRK